MPIFDPLYGELLTSKEVSEMTGFTLNQLRNWRMPARHEKAPFGYVSIGASPHYRRVVIQAWLDRNGGTNKRYVPLGIDAEFPLSAALEADETKQRALREVGQINAENAYFVWFDKFSKLDYKRLVDKLNDRSAHYKAKVLGGQPEDYPHISAPQRLSQPEWFTGAVPAMRELFAELNGYELTDDEILSVPIGSVPPLTEKHK